MSAPPLHRLHTHRVVQSVSWPGVLELRDRRLLFSPEDPAAPAHARLDVALESMIDARHNATEGLLVVELPGAHPVRFVGNALTDLHATLRSIVNEPTNALDPRERPVAEVHAVSLRSGPIIHRGSLRLDEAGLHYTPHGLLDNLIGVRPRSIPWNDVHRIIPRSGELGLIEIHHADGRTVFEPAAPEGLFPSLIAGLHAVQLELQESPQRFADAVSEIIAARAGQSAPAHEDTVTLSLHGTPEHGFETGLLLIDDADLRFLPRSPGASALVLPLGTLVRRSGRLRRLPTLRLASGATHHTFVPATGAATTSALWQRVHAPSRVIPWDQLGHRTRARFEDAARFVHISLDDAEPLDVGPLLSCGEDGTLIMPGSTLDGAHIGARLTVEVGHEEGVYAFEATLGARRFRPDGPQGPSQTTLELREIGSVRVYNQRQGYRAGTTLAATASVVSGDTGPALSAPIPMVVDDLSIGGCRALAQAVLVPGSEIDLWLDLGDTGVRARAAVLRHVPAASPGTTAHGLRFEHIATADEDRIHAFVLEQQRFDLNAPPPDPNGPEDDESTISQDSDTPSTQGPTVTG